MNLHVLLLCAFLLCLICIAYQDIRYRSVPLYVFLIAGILAMSIQYEQCGIDEIFILQLLLNSGFVAINLFVVLLYIKKVKKIPLKKAIGLGDLVFYIVLIPILSTPVYMYFHLASLLLILICYSILKNTILLQTKAIPLAGLQAFCLFFIIILFEYFILNKSIIGSCSIFYWI